jgi:hypothetical protein
MFVFSTKRWVSTCGKKRSLYKYSEFDLLLQFDDYIIYIVDMGC